MAKYLLSAVFAFTSVFAFGQIESSALTDRLQLSNSVPKDLLATKSVVLYTTQFQPKQLNEVQRLFQQTGIDAIAYFPTDVVFAGRDITNAYSDYLISREVGHLIFLDKNAQDYSIVITPFNNLSSFVDDKQSAWQVKDANLTELLMNIYRTALNNQKRKNLLINDIPETSISLTFITGRRSVFYAIDLKVDNLAVPWFGDAAKDSVLGKFFKENYPFSYKMIDPSLDEKTLRKQGFHYILKLVHARNLAAYELLGFTQKISDTALTSVTFPEGQPQLKTIQENVPVYKFYFKHIESGNVFLGTKWDSDVTWQEALRNHIKGFKVELKIE